VKSNTLEFQNKRGRNTILAHSPSHLCVISGFRGDINKVCAFWGYYTAWNYTSV